MTDGLPPERLGELAALFHRERLEDAIAYGASLAAQFPHEPIIPNLQGAAHARLGDFEAAVASFEKALILDPGFADAHFNLGNVLRRLGRIRDAAESFGKAIECRPDYADACLNLGITLEQLGNPREAAANYIRAIRIAPDFPEAHNNLGAVLSDMGQLEDAIACYRRALQSRPEFAEACNNLGEALNRLQDPEAAAASCRRALAIRPDYAEAHNNLGNALKHLGKTDEAVASYARALAIAPAYAEAHRNLSTLKTYRDDDEQFRTMRRLVGQSDVSAHERMLLGFALGKAWSDIARYDESFDCLTEANRLRKAELGYDIAVTRERYDRLVAAFSGDSSAPTPADVATHRSDRQVIFIVGMPRSGTTLVEQILASHPEVHGAGELDLLDRAVHDSGWPAVPPSAERLRAVGNAYQAGLDRIVTSRRCITDKMPFNFWWIGFILSIWPDAKIVHVRRDARATCWSNFKTFFSNTGIGFDNDLADIAAYYRLYAEIMAFWHRRFPGRIFDLDYETLIGQQEAETRRLLEYAGLDWAHSCLAFHETERAVQTASAAQVRRELYRDRSDDWQHYRKHLAPLLERLADL